MKIKPEYHFKATSWYTQDMPVFFLGILLGFLSVSMPKLYLLDAGLIPIQGTLFSEYPVTVGFE